MFINTFIRTVNSFMYVTLKYVRWFDFCTVFTCLRRYMSRTSVGKTLLTLSAISQEWVLTVLNQQNVRCFVYWFALVVKQPIDRSMLININVTTHTMRTIAIDNPVAWAFVSLSFTRATVVTRLQDGATLMRPLLHCCSHLFMYVIKLFQNGPIAYPSHTWTSILALLSYYCSHEWRCK